MSRSAARSRKISTASPTASGRRSPRAARRWSIASISSTATRPIPPTRSIARETAYACGRALGRAVRHQRRHAARRSRAHRRRSRADHPRRALGIHAHNDTENAVANSLAAVRAGARQIQGTLNGLGERCGNANLVSLIPTLALKADFADRFEIGVSAGAAARARQVSHTLDELLNRAPDRHAPYVGASAFATKAGIHASALAKDPRTYEHVPPESGRQRARDSRLRSGRPLESARPIAAHEIRRRGRRSAPFARARRGEGARGAGLCL